MQRLMSSPCRHTAKARPTFCWKRWRLNLPIVATAVGGVPEMVENNESALLVPPNDPPSIAAAIARLLTDRELAQRLTTNAATLVDTRYTPENYVRSLVEIYREVVETNEQTPWHRFSLNLPDKTHRLSLSDPLNTASSNKSIFTYSPATTFQPQRRHHQSRAMASAIPAADYRFLFQCRCLRRRDAWTRACGANDRRK